MKPTSAGFLIRSNRLYLLCHATQNPDYIYNDEDPFWSIPKGIVEEGEDPLKTALREVNEETGLDLTSYVKPNDKPLITHTSKHKHYIIYLADDPFGFLLRCELKCSSLINNDRFPLRNGLPEHDMFKWVTKSEGRKLIFPSLKHIFTLHDA